MSDLTFSEDRAKGVRRLLYVILGFVVLLVILALPLVFGDYARYGLIVLGVSLVLGILGGLALQAVRGGSTSARRLCLVTGAATIILSVPLIPIWVGLLTAVAGIGLLAVVLAPERDPA